MVHVKWLDHFSMKTDDGSWMKLEPEEFKALTIDSLGYIVQDTPELLTIAPHMASQGDVHSTMSILKCCILELDYLSY